MDPSPLLELAAELRNRIYELTFTNPPIEFKWTIHDGSVPYLEPHSNRRLGLALTATCKQIKQECGRGMFYANNDFIMLCHWIDAGYQRTPTGYADVIRRFIATIGFGNALAARTLFLSLARMDWRHFVPAIQQLHPLCEAIKLPLKVAQSWNSPLQIDMLQLHDTGNLVADTLDTRPWSSNQRPAPRGTLLREVCQRAVSEERRSRESHPKWIFCRVCGESRQWRATTVLHMEDEGCAHIAGAEMATTH
ncbi:hypothetical protein LTR91_020121 [Friedmanniomyces endolithicus]|uniref:Uncharacterized protein n=1 Tax=Friedmanniomyces endolithicus TaxID=329885 RepID=A0AAN6H9G3_9PEZI|nr:hypothetical protein LTR94_007646 [Friedmanniomyces endolithicus]KAK0773155.1 hypothetical protein LTR59_015379 [Friedmanniomyces endolithicus]KAK0800538.1 hypothetical protein LTR38_007139 [Friedmanniomyces endolithicus]KAK0809882.1 hypothetical protein LTR75_005739 [Friedmanniomyces endolithicus]KAK0833268.1 hypothetical protein LTR03_014928 [Friedmanniomyces endolithicus]